MIEYYSAIKRKEVTHLCQHGRTLRALCKVKYVKKNKYCMIPLIGGIIQKKNHKQKRGQICGHQKGN